MDAPHLAAIARSVIEQEGPIRQDEIMRRVASFFGRDRLGGRAAQNLAAAFDLLKTKAAELCRDGEFWLTANQKRAPQVRCRASAPARLQKLAMIAPVEIKAAIEMAGARAKENGEADLAAAVAALLGLPRRPARARARAAASSTERISAKI
ncbi:DUF3320 domain-containing protein [Methylocella silvestris]|nr:DUF3320 domain-containing protein [Methylocella silvestris]